MRTTPELYPITRESRGREPPFHSSRNPAGIIGHSAVDRFCLASNYDL